MVSFDDSDDVLARAAAWRQQGHGVALATVVSTWGSAPRPSGSQLAVREDGAFVGSVSGGCIEGAVVQEALAVIADGAPRVLEFGVSSESAWQVGLACGGTVRVLVERAQGDVVARVLAARDAKRPVVLVTDLGAGEHRLIDPYGAEGGAGSDAELVRAARDAAVRDRSALHQHGGAELFLRVYNPRLRLVIIGAVHIAQALAPMARLAGFDVVIVDPRTAFATAERFPGVTVRTDWPDEALAALALDRRAAVVTLSHDSKLDEPALIAALASPAFYIGALGSRKTQAARLRRLREHGLDDAALGRIHGPVGVAIGAQSAAEIAVSILAQVIARLRFAGEPAIGAGA